jgi:hypothetical protein
MNKFLDLLEKGEGLSIAEQKRQASKQFSQKLSASNFRAWSPDDPIMPRGKRMLIGIAPYSHLDLRLLDILDNALGKVATNQIRVEVFNVLECATMEDFDRYIPALGKVFQTPVAGIWIDGELKEKAWGRDARELIKRIFDLEPSAIKVEEQVSSKA